MARKPSSTNSSFRLNRNGSGRAGSYCCCRTVTKDRAPNIPAAARTLSSTLCRGQYSGLQSDYFGAVLSPAPPANETRFHQTARDHDAKEFVARRICVVARERIYQWKVRGNSRLSRRWTGQQNETRDSLFGQNLLRPYQLPRGKEDRQRRHHSNGTALSVARNEIEIDDESFSENDRNRLVPGRT